MNGYCTINSSNFLIMLENIPNKTVGKKSPKINRIIGTNSKNINKQNGIKKKIVDLKE